MKKFLIISLFLIHSLVSNAGDLIGGIKYGDSEEVVIKKLDQSGLAKAQIDKSMFARTGINGAYETTNSLKGMRFKLFFDWNRFGSDKSLNQITFRSSPIQVGAYNSILKSAWVYAQNLLSSMYGKPTNEGDFPKLTKLSESGIMYSHEWRTSDGYVYLGIGKQNAKLNLSIGFHKNQLSSR